jgi:ubiquinone/menaquinone biosynthesis C-methylase UbiE
MRTETLAILCSPLEHALLELTTDATVNGEAQQFLVNHEHGLKFPIRDGIPLFVEPHQITGINNRFRRIYDGWAPFYDLLSRVGLYLLGVSELKLRKEFVEKLEIKPGDRVLATSVGTGSDVPFLPRDCDYYGLDLSAGMLKVCQKKLRKLDAAAELFLGQAEHLPFRDGSFDVVYQMGGINFFSDQGKAIHEMVRVAKNGSKIVIMDETEKVARTLEHIPGINAWFRHQHRPIIPPTTLIPAGMEQVKYRELYDGQAWYLSFRKPQRPAVKKKTSRPHNIRQLVMVAYFMINNS